MLKKYIIKSGSGELYLLVEDGFENWTGRGDATSFDTYEEAEKKSENFYASTVIEIEIKNERD